MNDLVIMKHEDIFTDSIEILRGIKADGRFGFVYAIETKNGVKVGRTINPYRRIKTIISQSNVPVTRIYLTDKISNSNKVEISTHKVLSNYRELGEWFNCSIECAVDAINTIERSYYAPAENKESMIKAIHDMVIPKDWYEKFLCKLDKPKYQLINDDIEYFSNELEIEVGCCENDLCDTELSNDANRRLTELKHGECMDSKIKIIQGIAENMFESFPLKEIDKYLAVGTQAIVDRVLGVTYISWADDYIMHE